MSIQAGEPLKKILNHLKLSAKILEDSDINYLSGSQQL